MKATVHIEIMDEALEGAEGLGCLCSNTGVTVGALQEVK